jgi:hypothetical protein
MRGGSKVPSRVPDPTAAEEEEEEDHYVAKG